MTNLVEQKCIIRAIKKTSSGFSYSLEPKKQKCKGCDGKCAKMLKPQEYISIDGTKEEYKLNQEVLVYMNKKHLVKLVSLVLGVPLLELLLIVLVASYFNFSEILIISAIFVVLVITFIFQTKYLKGSKQLNIKL